MSQENETKSLIDMLAGAGPGNAVKALLTLRKISQNELSARLGVSSSEISRVISGQRRTHYIRAGIAKELGIPVEVLFKDGEGQHASRRQRRPSELKVETATDLFAPPTRER